MKRVGSLCLKSHGNQAPQHYNEADVPTRRKESTDLKSIYTQASCKDSTQHQLRSTSLYSRSYEQFSLEDHLGDSMKQEEQDEQEEQEEPCTFGSNSSVSVEYFDSLDVCNQEAEPSQTFLTKLVCLQNIFKQLKQLRDLQKDKSQQKQLSHIENTLLSLERQFIQQ